MHFVIFDILYLSKVVEYGFLNILLWRRGSIFEEAQLKQLSLLSSVPSSSISWRGREQTSDIDSGLFLTKIGINKVIAIYLFLQRKRQ